MLVRLIHRAVMLKFEGKSDGPREAVVLLAITSETDE